MAVPPPFDNLTKLPALAVNKLSVALPKLVDFLKKLAIDVVQKAGNLPKNIKCSDPRVVRIKQLLEKIKDTIDRILNVLTIVTTIVVVLNVTANIASTALQGSLAIPVPSPPALAQVINVLNTLIPNILAAVKQLSVILPILTVSIAGISALLGTAINVLGSVCTSETFSVNTSTVEGMIKNLDSKIKDVINNNINNNNTSNFYQLSNVSQEDIDNRNKLAEELLTQQRPEPI